MALILGTEFFYWDGGFICCFCKKSVPMVFPAPEQLL